LKAAYDLVIVGGGSAGLTAAGFAVQLGARVALVEKQRTGGDCTWTGCVPSKTLLKVAKVAHQMRTAHLYGLEPVQPAVDLKRIMGHVRAVIFPRQHADRCPNPGGATAERHLRPGYSGPGAPDAVRGRRTDLISAHSEDSYDEAAS
jgi:phytoene dehydrogenase-like protein